MRKKMAGARKAGRQAGGPRVHPAKFSHPSAASNEGVLRSSFRRAGIAREPGTAILPLGGHGFASIFMQLPFRFS